MHANVSLWKGKSKQSLDDLIEKAEAELVPKLRAQEGFVHFDGIVTPDETLILVHTWESKEAADRGVRPLIPWLLKNAATKVKLISRHSGPVVVSTTADE